MDTRPKANLAARKALFVFLLLVICIVVGYSIFDQHRPWVVPPEYKSLKNPLQATDSNLKAAAQVYRDECAQCHGVTGKGDGPESRTHSPAPADLTDVVRMNGVTDGEIFYQITTGRRPMPSFKNRITEEQRWQLTLLVRSFSQKTVETDKKPEEPGEKQPSH